VNRVIKRLWNFAASVVLFAAYELFVMRYLR
jgi:hypothetical protein